jgi:hypothetical protein
MVCPNLPFSQYVIMLVVYIFWNKFVAFVCQDTFVCGEMLPNIHRCDGTILEHSRKIRRYFLWKTEVLVLQSPLEAILVGYHVSILLPETSEIPVYSAICLQQLVHKDHVKKVPISVSVMLSSGSQPFSS